MRLIIILSGINLLWDKHVYKKYAEITAYRSIPTPTMNFHKSPIWGNRTNCSVDTIIQDLKLLGYGQEFNASAFESRENEIYRSLLQIGYGRGEGDSSLTKKLLYAEEIFQALVDAKELLKFFSLKKTRDQRILRKIIRINIILLSLYDADNQPNYRSEKYAEIVLGPILDLDKSIHKFGRIGFVPLTTRLAFDEEVDKAKTILLYLSRFVSGDGASGWGE